MNVWQGKTILVVDDSSVLRKALTEVYRSMGLNPIGDAENGLKALEFIESEVPDIVSLDIIMPEMDGIECYRKIRDIYSEIDLLIVSALASDTGVSESFSDEIPSYVFSQKPFTKKSLADSLELVLAKHVGLVDPSKTNSVRDDEKSGKINIPDVNQSA